ncbi:unnamed protein product [Linum trigynum]|uniref:SWIM-type domain-containing protein n=1 Tax=Linum trigynum TaxID=586398 RepID=A0AAV2FF43_9ROSI
MEGIQQSGVDMSLLKDFLDNEPETFCRAFMSHVPRCDSVESNICETFNGYILEEREDGIIDMLEGIRKKLMVRFVDKNKQIARVQRAFCPRIEKRLMVGVEMAKMCTVNPALNDKFEVVVDRKGFVVDMEEHSCTCGYWGLTGIPCHHVVCIRLVSEIGGGCIC